MLLNVGQISIWSSNVHYFEHLKSISKTESWVSVLHTKQQSLNSFDIQPCLALRFAVDFKSNPTRIACIQIESSSQIASWWCNRDLNRIVIWICPSLLQLLAVYDVCKRVIKYKGRPSCDANRLCVYCACSFRLLYTATWATFHRIRQTVPSVNKPCW